MKTILLLGMSILTFAFPLSAMQVDLDISVEVVGVSEPGLSDGKILVTSVVGGTPPYNYAINIPGRPVQLSKNFHNLGEGSYFVRVIDSSGNTGGLQVNVPVEE